MVIPVNRSVGISMVLDGNINVNSVTAYFHTCILSVSFMNAKSITSSTWLIPSTSIDDDRISYHLILIKNYCQTDRQFDS